MTNFANLISRWSNFRARDRGRRGQQRIALRALQERNPNTRQQESFLREIDVSFSIRNFAPGETLASLSFDGQDITPSPALVATQDGEIDGTFTIPPETPAGIKAVEAEGSAQSWAAATFTGTVIVRTEPRPRPRNFCDPVAQTFTLEEGRWITSIDVAFRARGSADNPVQVQIRSTITGEPSGEVLAEGQVGGDFSLSGWTNIPLNRPFWAGAGIEYSFTLRTDDDYHRVGLAEKNEFDPTANQWVTRQPYAIGVLLKSSNNRAWTVFQNQDLMFRIKCAKFTSDTRTVNLGPVRRLEAQGITQDSGVATVEADGHGFEEGATVVIHGADQIEYNGAHVISNVTPDSFEFAVDSGAVSPATGTFFLAPGLTSDLAVRGSMVLPSPECEVGFRYQLADDGGTEYMCVPNQKAELDSRISHGMNLFMDIIGGEKVSPYVFEGLQPVVANMHETATYISRAIPCVDTDRLEVNYDAYIPSAAGVSVELEEGAPGSPLWSSPIPINSVTAITEYWADYNHSIDPFANGGTETRVKLTLSGTPAARPALNELRLAALFTG